MAIPYSRTIVGNIPWYSVMIVLGILVAILLGEREERRLALPKDTIIDLALIAVPSGIVGARLYYVAMTWELFAANPISILYIWEGGIAIYGAVIGGMLGVLIYAKKKELPFWRLIDALIPGLLLAQAIGRWGNYFNMEAYGPEIKNTLFHFFPAGVLIPQGSGYVWHMATFFYESLWNACGFIALWAMRKKQQQDGNTFCWYLLIYGSGRFIIEQLRMDSLYWGNVRVSQMLSLILCAVAALVLLWRTAGERRVAFGVAAAGAMALIARWFALDDLWIYTALLVLGTVSCALPAMISGRAGKGLWWLIAVLTIDVLGLCLSLWVNAAWLSFAARLHTLLCSLTLPLYIYIAVALLKANDEEG